MLDLEMAKKVFDNLYQDVHGYTISSQARNKLAYHDKSYTYGEVTPEAMYKILTKIKYPGGGIFYDLGSGTGKAVLLAALLSSFSECKGVEILKDLNDTAKSVSSRFESEMKVDFPSLTSKIEFLNEDFLKYDFSDADVIFIHSTCFYDELWSQLIKKFEDLRLGTTIITVTKSIVSPVIEPLLSEGIAMGWGQATVNFYQKI